MLFFYAPLSCLFLFAVFEFILVHSDASPVPVADMSGNATVDYLVLFGIFRCISKRGECGLA